MKASVIHEYGGPEVLQVAEVPEPHAGSGQVRIRVVVAGVNPFDYKLRRGYLAALRPLEFPAILGAEAAGIVDEVGDGVTVFKVGDEVMGWTITGSYAEFALASDLAHKPAELDWETAAALPVAAETTDRVFGILVPKEGETLLIHGAASVVGSVATQLAVAQGVTVIGTASAGNHDYLRSLGAIPVLYGDEMVDQVRAVAPQGIDAVFDATGYDVLKQSIELRGGNKDRIVTIADHQRAAELGVTSTGSGRSFGEQLGPYARLAAEGKLHVRIHAGFSLAEADKAQMRSEAGHPKGKLLIYP